MAISAESKVGFVFILGMIALAVITIMLGNFTLFDKGNIYYIVFDDVRGLNVGDAVRMNGLDVGRIQTLTITGSKIQAVIWTKSNVIIRQGSRISIQDDTLIGGKVLAIAMGPTSNPIIPSGSVLYSDKSQTTKDVFNEMAALGGDIRELVVSFNANQKVFFDQINTILTEDRELLQVTVSNFNEMAIDFQDVAGSVLAISRKIEDGEGTVGKLISSDELYVDAREITQKINRITGKIDGLTDTFGVMTDKISTTADKFGAVADNVNSLTDDVKQGKGTIGKLLREEDFYRQLQAISGQFKTFGDKMNTIADKLNSNQGTVGKLINEDTLHVKAAAAIDQARTTMRDISDFTTKARETNVYLGGSNMWNFERNETLSQVYLKIAPNPHKYYSIGAAVTAGRTVTKKDRDAEVDLDAIIAYNYLNDRVTLRGGLMESRIGGGVDYHINPNTKIAVEGRDTYKTEEQIHPIRMRSYVEYKPVKNFAIRAGGDNLTEDANFWLGGSFEFEDKDLKYLITTLGLAQ